MMEIKKVLSEFVKECSEKLELESIIQFGSSTYSGNFHDIDLIFIDKNAILHTKDILKLIKIIKIFEKKYEDLVFDFAGLERKRKKHYSITVLLICKEELNIKYNPNDIFLFKSIKEDKNKKILFGKDIFEKLDFSLTNRHLFEMLVVELKRFLRKSLDDIDYRNESIYHLFKTLLRVMLINEGNFKKEELLDNFRRKFEKEIKLPRNSGKILKRKFEERDFEDILKFTEDCLGWLTK